MAGELGKRVAVAAVGIPIAVLLIFLGGAVFGVFVALIAAAAGWVVFRIAEARDVRPFTGSGVPLAAAFVLIATFHPAVDDASPLFWQLLLIAMLILSGAAIWLRGVEGKPLTSVGITLFGALLTGGALSFAIFLGALAPAWSVPSPGESVFRVESWTASPWAAPAVIGFPLLLTWMSDTAAYFGGRAWGRRKLIPSVSPGKTVAGAVSGVVGTIMLGAVYGRFVLHGMFGMDLSLVGGALGGAIISVVAQIGDLSESLLKREAGVKDSGALLPGHGGVFDRFDSLLFAFPVAYWYLSLVLS
jgi:phosphatidate cytidylyltransferase